VRWLLAAWAILAVAVWVTAAVVPGIDVDGGVGTYLWIALVLATVNLLLGPIARLLTLPVVVLTLGLFCLVINAALLLLTAWLVDSFHVDGLWPAIVGSIVISLVTWILDLILTNHRQAAAAA